MPAYIIARITVTDAKKYEKYKALAPACIAAYGGRYLTRGGAMETLEGFKEGRRMVLLEFPTMDKAREFYSSTEYAAAKAKRKGAAKGQFVLLEGL